MCDEALLSLAKSVQNGIEPYAIFWNDVDCGGISFPEENHRPVLDTTMTSENTPSWPSFKLIRSMFIPENIIVEFRTISTSGSTGKYTIIGPRLVTNIHGDLVLNSATWMPLHNDIPCPPNPNPTTACGKLHWCVNAASTDSNCCSECWMCQEENTCDVNSCEDTCSNRITTGSIHSIRLIRRAPWSTYIKKICADEYNFTIGPYHIRKEQAVCDAIMKKYCEKHIHEPICGCYYDAQTSNDTSIPLNCFGPNCMSSKAYKSGELNDQMECTLKNCKDIISTEKSAFADKTHVSCGNYVLKLPLQTKAKIIGPILLILLIMLFTIFVAIIQKNNYFIKKLS